MTSSYPDFVTVTAYGSPYGINAAATGTVQPQNFLLTTEDNNTTGTSSDNSGQVFQIFTIAIGVGATVINAFVLFVMIYYKLVTKNTTNVFIFNQSTLDFIASVGVTLCTLLDVLGMTSYSPINLTYLGRAFLCYITDSQVVFISPIYASQAGLMVITFERYFKIVHPIGHRKYFRQWMVKAGVVLPWIMGAITYVIPVWATTTMTDGICSQFTYTSLQLMQTYVITIFIYTLVFPLVSFMLCYGRIFSVIRHQNQVTADAVQQSTATKPPATVEAVGRQNYEEVARATGSGQLTQSQKNVVRTAVMVTFSYLICWFPIQFYMAAGSMQLLPIFSGPANALTGLAYLNMLFNPIIYAAHFDVVKRFYRVVRRLCHRSNWLPGEINLTESATGNQEDNTSVVRMSKTTSKIQHTQSGIR